VQVTSFVHLYGVKNYLVPPKALEDPGFLLMGRGSRALENRTRSRHTIYRGQPDPKNPRYSGFRGLFGVCCLRLQRLGSCVGFGTGTRMAPNKSIWLVRVSSRARRTGSKVPSVRAWRAQKALFGGRGFSFLLSGFLQLQIALRGRKPALAQRLQTVDWPSRDGGLRRHGVVFRA
jgi:hypothetical protein